MDTLDKLAELLGLSVATKPKCKHRG
jgi:hypothetical protein